MKTTETIQKLFNSKWNYAWGRVDEYLIYLFYKKGGFIGLRDYVISEKERMIKSRYDVFENYYSSDLIEKLIKATTECKDSDFRDYVFNSMGVIFNKNNFEKLESYGMLEHYYDFGGSFRGNIVELHKIGKYSIIESHDKKEGSKFYNVGDFTTCFNSLEQALICKIFNGKYFDTLNTLLNASKEN